MNNEMEIKNNIIKSIKNVSGVDVKDENGNLMSLAFGIPEYTFLYIIDFLEKEFDYPICKILEENDFTVFTVKHLASKINSLIGNKINT